MPNDEIFRFIDPVDQDTENEVVQPLTLEEVTSTLKGCADSAPGPDGIPYSYLKHFWATIGH